MCKKLRKNKSSLSYIVSAGRWMNVMCDLGGKKLCSELAGSRVEDNDDDDSTTTILTFVCANKSRSEI